MLNRLLLAVSFILAASSAFGQATIVDSKPMNARSNNATLSQVTSRQSSVQANTAMYSQLQVLQEEVRQLRGMLEQQSYELKRLKQQRLDDYLDLDRRIGQQGVGASVPAKPLSGVASAKPESQTDTVFKEGEFASYQAAIGFALKKRDFDSAISALLTHLESYPQGNYVANAQYWLGQIYLQKEDLQQSKLWFSRMTQQYPNHQKTQEATFKLAKVHHKLGDTVKAKALLKSVSESGGSASGLAREYLKQHY